jgi:asparagine synthase (glutamine-hydrolysing)
MASLTHRFKSIFNNHSNVRKEAYFDKMTHFDFKCLLPALLQVEDRMSMAHGLESRVPFLDHPLVEFAATIPANIKFPGGQLKNMLKTTFHHKIPPKILNRRDKMGFPVPLREWFSGPLKDFVFDTFAIQNAKTRGFYDPRKVLKNMESNQKFSRKTWGLLSLELWHQIFQDQHQQYKIAA